MASSISLVETSQRMGATASHKQKIRELADFLRQLSPDEIETAVHYLSGEMTQGSLAALADIRGAGSAARRSAALAELFSASTAARDFLLHLMSGELRQGALLGVMVDAIAAAGGHQPLLRSAVATALMDS